MSAPAIPVTLVGGYLGAGKTTLVNHLLRHADGRRIAVLVNEFGDLPIDDDLIEARDEDLITIAGGCVCCSFGSDLVAALMALKARTPAVEHIVIEASGVALPGAVVQATALLPDIAIDGVIVLADAETVEARARDRYMGDTILRQLADADLILLNKTDLVAAKETIALASWLQQQAPRARVLPVENSQIPIDLALGLRTDRLGARGSARPHDASRYETFVAEPGAASEIGQLCERLAEPGLGILRAKGFVRDGNGRTHSLHVVGSRVSATPEAESRARESRLVFIGLSGRLDRDAILSILSGR